LRQNLAQNLQGSTGRRRMASKPSSSNGLRPRQIMYGSYPALRWSLCRSIPALLRTHRPSKKSAPSANGSPGPSYRPLASTRARPNSISRRSTSRACKISWRGYRKACLRQSEGVMLSPDPVPQDFISGRFFEEPLVPIGADPTPDEKQLWPRLFKAIPRVPDRTTFRV
jgi:hypothetical protein